MEKRETFSPRVVVEPRFSPCATEAYVIVPTTQFRSLDVTGHILNLIIVDAYRPVCLFSSLNVTDWSPHPAQAQAQAQAQVVTYSLHFRTWTFLC